MPVRVTTRRPMGRSGSNLLRRLFSHGAIALTVGAGFITVAITTAEAKRPGSTYCFVGKCHRVKTLGEMQRLVGKDVYLHASHYGHCKKDRFNPCGLTSSGTVYKPHRPDNAASPIYPDGTRLLVWNPATKAAAMIRINNAGPYWGNRKLDVSRATAEKLGFKRQGVAKLKTRVISAPDRRESRYVRNRKYESVAGYLGKFASLDDAEHALAAVLAVRAMAASSLAPVIGAVVAAAHGEPVGAEGRRKSLAKKAASLIARLDDSRQDPASQFASVTTERVGDNVLRFKRKGMKPVARAQLAALAPPLPLINPQHRSRRLAGIKATRPAIPTPIQKAEATAPEPTQIAALSPPLPSLSPQHLSRRLGGVSGPSDTVPVVSLNIPLPEFGPARWRIAARNLPPPPVGKPTRLAEAQKQADVLDELAWSLEQVLIQRHFSQTRSSAIIDIDNAPFEPIDGPFGSDERAVPINNSARAGRMG